MTTGWLAFVESNTSGTGRLFARAASDLGCRPILLSRDASRYAYAREDGLETLEVDTGSAGALQSACRTLRAGAGLAGITSSSEYFIAAAAAVASSMGLPGPRPDAVRSCRNKWKQRVLLKNAGVGVPRFECVTSIKAARAAAEEFGFPVVVKPVNGTGSCGVRLCEDGEQVASQARSLLAERRNERGQPIPRRVLVEQLAVGPEYSVETFDRRVIGVTKKRLGELPYFVEVGHDYPSVFSNGELGEITRAVETALDALNLGWGPAHFELRLTTEGLKMIEVNPRLAGGYIPELVRLASGIDLIRATIAKVAGEDPRLEKRLDRYASLRFILPPADGTLARVEGMESAAGVGGIVEARLYCKPGDRLSRRGDFRDRIGHTIAASENPAAARAAAELARSRINLIVSPN